VAYSSPLQERQRGLHARIVEALESLAGDRVAEQVERLAHHALRGEVWDRALAYCRQAGKKAMARSAYREAVGYFEQALSALSHLPETAQQSVLAVWEDLQWADPSTLELLELLQNQVPTARLLLVLTARPEFHPPWAPRSMWPSANTTERFLWRPIGLGGLAWHYLASRRLHLSTWIRQSRTTTPSSTVPWPSAMGKTLGRLVGLLQPLLCGGAAFRTRPCGGAMEA
jgi:hypothetical protein